MTTLVQEDVYATADGSYSVGYVVTYEPKNPTSPYRVDISVNHRLTAMVCFDSREAAIHHAVDSQLRLWQLRTVLPAVHVTILPAEVAPTRSSPTRESIFTLTDPSQVRITIPSLIPHVSGDDCACDGCNPEYEGDEEDMNPFERSEAASQRAYREQRYPQRVFDASPRLYVTDEIGHLSRHPAQCRCGDCLTYLAGE